MTDEEYESCKARVDALFAKWRPILYLHNTAEFAITYFREAADFAKATNAEASGTIMTVIHSWEYENSNIRVNCPEVLARADDDLEADAIHELGHILLGPLQKPKTKPRRLSGKLEEKVVTHLTKALLRAYAAGRESVSA